MDEIEDCIRLLQWRLLAPLLVETRNVCPCAASAAHASDPKIPRGRFHSLLSAAAPYYEVLLPPACTGTVHSCGPVLCQLAWFSAIITIIE